MIHTRTSLVLWRLVFAVLVMAAVLASSVLAQDRVETGWVLEPPVDDFKVHLLGEREDPKPRQGPLQVLGLDDRPQLKAEIEGMAYESRRIIRQTTRIDWEGTAWIVWSDRESDYSKMTGKRAEFTAAAANARKHTIWINGNAWRRSTPVENQKVMTHEIGHLLVGNLPGGRNRLPLWAEEGIVQHLADEWTFQKEWTLARAHAFDQLPTLASLEDRFPEDPEGQLLAYAYGYRGIVELAQSFGDDTDSLERVMRRLADEKAGPELNQFLWEDNQRDALDRQVRESLGSRVTSAVLILTSGMTFWIIAMVLAVWAWGKKKRDRILASRAAEEEAWAESLTEEDIQEVWGDREDRWEEVEETPWDRYERERDAERENERWM